MIEFTYRLPESVVADTKAFRSEVDKFLSGEISAVAFRGIRVPMGIYEQRTNDTYMVRVRGAAGIFLSDQVKLIADLSTIYGNGTVHVTTRQDLQIHNIKIEDTPTILEHLLAAGLSSRGGGGNTVRNISVCPFAGVGRDEVFDVTPYALALTEYLIRERRNFNLPRKFKVAFSGCSRDCGLASIADLGFFAHEHNGVRGFAVYAGGGMGANSALGIRIEEFVSDTAIFEIAEAVKRLFDKYGDRANRSKARLRYVVERLGKEEFRRAYHEELKLVQNESIQVPSISISERKTNISAVQVNLLLGDITSDKLLEIADISSRFGDGIVRTTQEQNLQLRVPESQVEDVLAAVHDLDQRFTQAQSIHCVACTGASTCKLGLCLSRGLAGAIETELADVSLPFTTTIQISGCPNSCGHHPVASVGLYGTAVRVNGRLVPFYNIVAGGRLAEGNSALAQSVAKIPAKAVPALLKEFWASAAKTYETPETLNDLMDRWGIAYLHELAVNYERVPLFEDELGYYRDFGSSADFTLAGRGPGECGAGVTDVIALDIDEAKRAVREDRLYDAVLLASRALLVTRGLEPRKDREVFEAFSEHLIVPGRVLSKTQNLLDAALDLKLGDRDTLDDLRDEIELLINRVDELFQSLDSNLDFRVEPSKRQKVSQETSGSKPANEIDLRGVTCPMNFVRAKMQLSRTEVGHVLDVILDNGEPTRNVPSSFSEQGQEVVSVTNEGDHSRVSVLRKK